LIEFLCHSNPHFGHAEDEATSNLRQLHRNPLLPDAHDLFNQAYILSLAQGTHHLLES
jgi:hypothetical protein